MGKSVTLTNSLRWGFSSFSRFQQKGGCDKKVKPPAREPVVTPAYYGPFAEYEEPATGGLLGSG